MTRLIQIWTWLTAILTKKTVAIILPLLCIVMPMNSVAKNTITTFDSSSGQPSQRVLMPNLEQLEKQFQSQKLAAIPALNATPTRNVSASITTNKDEAEKGRLAWTIGGSQTSPAWMVDPCRIINGRTNAVGAGWINFSGRVIDAGPDGILLDGTLNTVPKSDNVYDGEFFLANYPYPCAQNGTIGSYNQWFYARLDGTYTCTNDASVVLILYRLDYGEPWTAPPPTPGQLAARQKLMADAQAADVAKKNEILNRALKDNEDSAARGEPYGLLRMGERYRDGKGVERDLTKARDYFQRAADAGSDTAKSELEDLNVLNPKPM